MNPTVLSSWYLASETTRRVNDSSTGLNGAVFACCLTWRCWERIDVGCSEV